MTKAQKAIYEMIRSNPGMGIVGDTRRARAAFLETVHRMIVAGFVRCEETREGEIIRYAYFIAR